MSKVTTVKEWLHIIYMAVGIVAALASASVVYFKGEEKKTEISIPVQTPKEKINAVVERSTAPVITKKDTVIIIKKEPIIIHAPIIAEKQKQVVVKSAIVTEKNVEVKDSEEALFGITRSKKKTKDSTNRK